jgi:hypothetical protein
MSIDRPHPRRLLPGAVVGVLAAILAACSGSAPGGAESSIADGASQPMVASSAGSSAAGRGASIDACSLLTDAEILQVTGLAPVSKEDGDPFGVLGQGCDWKLADESEIVVPEVALGITTTGGRSYFDTYFKPYASQHVFGVGDDAIQEDTTSLMALEGDVLVEIQFVGGDANDVPRQLIEIVFSKF